MESEHADESVSFLDGIVQIMPALCTKIAAKRNHTIDAVWLPLQGRCSWQAGWVTPAEQLPANRTL